MSEIISKNIINVDLDKPLVRLNAGTLLASGDTLANRFGAQLYRGGAEVRASGYSVIGYLIKPNDETLMINGTASGNTVYVDIPQNGYAYDGAFTLTIKINGEGVKKAVAIFDGHIAKTATEAVDDGEHTLYGVEEILELIARMESAEGNANTAAKSANEAATNANEKATAANTAASDANSKAAAANTAAETANAAAEKIDNMTVEASGLAAGKAPTASVSDVDGHKHIAFGIPKGDKGDTGATPTLTMGAVTTGNPGTQASASITGTAEKPVLNLTIPRGDAGEGSVSTVDGMQPVDGDVPLGAVRYNATQSLSDSQKKQARENIGAGTGDGTVKSVDGASPSADGAVQVNAVRYTAQSLTEAERKQARDNLSALGVDNVSTIEITAADLSAKSTADRAALYANGARLLKVTNDDTIVVLSLASDGSTQFMSSNKPLTNLLDNSDFTNPVNQRGNTSYTDIGYTIDRWIKEDAGTATIGDNGFTIASTSEKEEIFLQKVDFKTMQGFYGKKMSLAVCDGDGVIHCGNAEINYTNEQSVIVRTNFEATFRLFDKAESYQFARFIVKAAASLTIKWAALYEGSYTTDTLPPYVPKGYAAELAECQRYFYSMKGYWKNMGIGVCESETKTCIPIRLPQAMRILPTAIIPNASLVKIRCGSVDSQVPSAIDWYNATILFDMMQLEATVSGATSGDIATLFFDDGGEIQFSADL